MQTKTKQHAIFKCLPNAKSELTFDGEFQHLDPQSNCPHEIGLSFQSSNKKIPPKIKKILARPGPFQLADPEALTVTHTNPKIYFDRNRNTSDQMAEEVHNIFKKCRNTVIQGFNSNRYDIRVMAQFFYEHGLSSYSHKLNNNVIADIRDWAILSDLVSQPLKGTILSKRDDGTFGSTLAEMIKNLNIQPPGQLHDALVDTIATVGIRNSIFSGDPALEEYFCDMQFSNFSHRTLLRADACIKGSFNRRIGANPQYVTCLPSKIYGENWLATINFTSILDSENPIDDTIKNIKSNGKNLSYTKTKETPPLVTIQHTLANRIVADHEKNKISDLGFRIKNDPRVQCAVAEQEKTRKATKDQSNFVELKIHDGFYSDSDLAKRQRWSISPPEQKQKIIDSIEDARMKHFLERIMFQRFPGYMPAKKLREMSEYLEYRLTTAEAGVPWVTVPSAMAKIEKLLETTVLQQHQNLLDYRKFLLQLQSNPTMLGV